MSLRVQGLVQFSIFNVYNQNDVKSHLTVNVDIFMCINFRGFMKMGNFVSIKIRVLSIYGSLGF